MLKKLLKGCLTVAMVSAFAASAYAEATFTWTGNVSAGFKQVTSNGKLSTGDSGGADALTTMDMFSNADLDLSVKQSAMGWTSEAKIELDIDDAQAITVDDMYVVMSNDSMDIWLGEFDPVGLQYGGGYVGELSVVEGGVWGIEDGGERGYAMAVLKDMGLGIALGFNTKADGANDYNETAYGVTYSKSMGDLGLSVQYFGASTAYASGDVTGDYDGATLTQLLFGVGYTMGTMVFGLNYEADNVKTGADAETKSSILELAFDMALDDTSGITVTINSNSNDDGSAVVSTTKTQVSYGFKLGDIDNYVMYGTSSAKSDADGAEAVNESMLGYSVVVGF